MIRHPFLANSWIRHSTSSKSTSQRKACNRETPNNLQHGTTPLFTHTTTLIVHCRNQLVLCDCARCLLIRVRHRKILAGLLDYAFKSSIGLLSRHVIGWEAATLVAIVHVMAHESVQLLFVIWRVDIETLIGNRASLPTSSFTGLH